ncbi:MAG: FkbM family methyltransferase [Methylacidiphilales bacterium]|nr:FkbM family methyltransferase [Candidatus Methylacidiphilales bacterium]
MNLDYKLVQLRYFLRCYKLYGLRNALKIMLRTAACRGERTITLPGGLRFTFRGKQDVGVITHFCKEGYFIEDSPQKRIHTIIDGGANIGDETARFRLHHPASIIVAIEPEESNFFILKKNFGAVPGIHLLKGGLWSSKCHLQVIPPIDGNPESFSVAETQASENSVDAYSIDSIMDMMGWGEIDILKLDIEGSEYELFTKNCLKWIDKINALIFEVPDSDRPGTTQEIYRALGDRAYDTYLCGENIILIKRGLPWTCRKVIGLSETRLNENFKLTLMHQLLVCIKNWRLSFFYSIIRCKHETLKTLGEKWTWTIDPTNLGADSVVYCAGAGDDISFEKDLVRHCNCNVIVLDPSPTGKHTMSLPENKGSKIIFEPYGLADKDAVFTFDVPDDPTGASYALSDTTQVRATNQPVTNFSCLSLPTLMKKYGHDHIDLLKMDIEGFEYGIIDQIIALKIPIRQICVEFHHFLLPQFSNIDTVRSIFRLRKNGFRLIYRKNWDHTFLLR